MEVGSNDRLALQATSGVDPEPTLTRIESGHSRQSPKHGKQPQCLYNISGWTSAMCVATSKKIRIGEFNPTKPLMQFMLHIEIFRL
jgi:hypothetical protein